MMFKKKKKDPDPRCSKEKSRGLSAHNRDWETVKKLLKQTGKGYKTKSDRGSEKRWANGLIISSPLIGNINQEKRKGGGETSTQKETLEGWGKDTKKKVSS